MRRPPQVARRCRSFCLTVLVAIGAFVIGAERADAQNTDVIRGRVTNSEGLPLPNVRVTATSIPGNVTREIRTNGQGNSQIAFPNGTGDYVMGYALIGYDFRQFEIKRVADEDVLIADAKLSVVQLDTVVTSVANQQRVSRNDRTPDVSGTEQLINASNLPIELIGDLAAMAASLPGVTLVPGLDGAADGFSVLGLGADQNTTTLNGMSMNGSNLPRDANITTSLTTSPYDGSRGGFSGANFNIRPGSGNNFRVRGMSLLVNSRGLEWTDPAAQAIGAKYTNLSLGGSFSGPIQYNKSFYSLSYQIDHRSNDNLTLINTSPIGLRAAGVAPDSATRLLSILRGRSVPLGSNFDSNQERNGASVFGNVDFSPPNSTSGQSVGLTFNANYNKSTSVAGGSTMLPSASGDRANWGGGLQGRHSGYLGMILSESQLGFSVAKNYADPYVELPSGQVLVASDLAGTSGSVRSLSFGGNQYMSASSRSLTGSLQNTLSWFDDHNKHRIKLSTELGYNSSAQDQGSNLLGTFLYNSLADVENAAPASFTRTLTNRARTTGQLTGGMSIGDSYRRTQDLQIQYSLRVDASHFTTTPDFNSNVERVFGLRNDHIPTPVVFSPRIGFSKTLGQSNEISAFSGAFRAPRAVWRGGVGVFANNASSGLLGTAIDNTGLPSGVQTINCVGPAAPVPDWATYATNLGAIPTTCADGTQGTVFANSAPNVTLVAKNYTPQKSVRGNTSWTGSILDARYSASVDLTYSLNLNQQRSVDLNFRPNEQFALGDDGRPVYAQTSSIVPSTGTIASRDARVSQEFSRVSELRSDLQSRSGQVTVRLSPIPHGPTRFTWNLAYTYQKLREQVSGFNSTAGNPLDVEWATSSQGPHSINYGLRYDFFRAVQVNWSGVFRSGSYYTPMIQGDVNGDGYFNDRAFVISPTDGTPVADQMKQLLATTSPAARDCLEKQLGHIAERNTCKGPWTSTATLNVTVDRVKFRLPNRASLSFSLSNPLGAADLALNGSGHLKGWGQTFVPDSRLLYVRGFDPTTRRYTYDVNQRFGVIRPDLVINRTPVVLNTQVKFDVGAMRERQNLSQQLGFGRNLPGSRLPEGLYRSLGTNSINNPMATILRQQDSLQLTALQADSIASMNRRYLFRSDSLWAPVARYLGGLPQTYHEDEAWDRFVTARRAQLDILSKMVPLVNGLLTKEQKRKLPQLVIQVLDPVYLASVRNGTGMYVGGSGVGSPGTFVSFSGAGGIETALVLLARP